MKTLNKLLIILLLTGIFFLSILLFIKYQDYLLLVLVATEIIVPVFYWYEKWEVRLEEIVLAAVITALTVVSRLAFAALPGTPVTAIIILIGIFWSKEMGFIIGALTALLSNLFLGHGTYTVFQMLSWGLIGFLSGLLRSFLWKTIKTDGNNPLQPLQILRNRNRNMFILFIYGVLAGILYSVLMDLHTIFFMYKKFSLIRYLTIISFAFPVTVEYIITNIIFLGLLAEPLNLIFERLYSKYNFRKRFH